MLTKSDNSPDVACLHKVMLKVIQHRLDVYMEQEMAIEQAGFTKGRGSRNQISDV